MQSAIWVTITWFVIHMHFETRLDMLGLRLCGSNRYWASLSLEIFSWAIGTLKSLGTSIALSCLWINHEIHLQDYTGMCLCFILAYEQSTTLSQPTISTGRICSKGEHLYGSIPPALIGNPSLDGHSARSRIVRCVQPVQSSASTFYTASSSTVYTDVSLYQALWESSYLSVAQ